MLPKLGTTTLTIWAVALTLGLATTFLVQQPAAGAQMIGVGGVLGWVLRVKKPKT
jgi:hypothetical protein